MYSQGTCVSYKDSMGLYRLTERVWVYPYEEKRDRPNLCYIKGDEWSLAVDAGHSDDHLSEFYSALEKEGLPLPKLTVLTHWHWDHTLAMHAVSGLTLANETTDRYLKDFKERIEKEGTDFFLALDESVRCEYAGGKPVIVKQADLTFKGEMHLDAGNCPIEVFEAQSPHTDDATLIYLPDEKVLFLGDSTSGEFPTWKADKNIAERMAETIRKLYPEICLHGHLPALSADVIIQYMFEEE